MSDPEKPAGSRNDSASATAPADDAAGEHVEGAKPPKTMALTIGLGVLSVVLLLLFVGSRFQLSARDTTIVQSKNHSDQVEDGMGALQTQLTAAQVESLRLQKLMEEAKSESALDKTAFDKARIETTEMQSQLDKARVASTEFQTQMADAKVVAIKHRGEVEVALAQTAVMKTQWAKGQADMALVQTQLAESRRASEGWQAKSEKAEKEIERLQSLPRKK